MEEQMAASKRKRPYDKRKFLGLVNSGVSLKGAMLAVGVPASQSLRGRKGVPKQLKDAWAADSESRFGDLVEKGATLTVVQQEKLIRGVLVDAAVNGEVKKGAVRAAEVLGRDRRVNMWTPDHMTGIIILDAPPVLPPLLTHGFNDRREEEIAHLEANIKLASDQSAPWVMECRAKVARLRAEPPTLEGDVEPKEGK
jgi:hypothetical protein